MTIDHQLTLFFKLNSQNDIDTFMKFDHLGKYFIVDRIRATHGSNCLSLAVTERKGSAQRFLAQMRLLSPLTQSLIQKGMLYPADSSSQFVIQTFILTIKRRKYLVMIKDRTRMISKQKSLKKLRINHNLFRNLMVKAIQQIEKFHRLKIGNKMNLLRCVGVEQIGKKLCFRWNMLSLWSHCQGGHKSIRSLGEDLLIGNINRQEAGQLLELYTFLLKRLQTKDQIPSNYPDMQKVTKLLQKVIKNDHEVDSNTLKSMLLSIITQTQTQYFYCAFNLDTKQLFTQIFFKQTKQRSIYLETDPQENSNTKQQVQFVGVEFESKKRDNDHISYVVQKECWRTKGDILRKVRQIHRIGFRQKWEHQDLEALWGGELGLSGGEVRRSNVGRFGKSFLLKKRVLCGERGTKVLSKVSTFFWNNQINKNSVQESTHKQPSTFTDKTSEIESFILKDQPYLNQKVVNENFDIFVPLPNEKTFKQFIKPFETQQHPFLLVPQIEWQKYHTKPEYGVVLRLQKQPYYKTIHECSQQKLFSFRQWMQIMQKIIDFTSYMQSKNHSLCIPLEKGIFIDTQKMVPLFFYLQPLSVLEYQLSELTPIQQQKEEECYPIAQILDEQDDSESIDVWMIGNILQKVLETSIDEDMEMPWDLVVELINLMTGMKCNSQNRLSLAEAHKQISSILKKVKKML